mmetsp:Transcript_9003/g.15839  ORF Transcript_9003/g.15839 Transcript_9003/m.15839 type:complete len:217 (+) Transcript_9003:142-792(+)
MFVLLPPLASHSDLDPISFKRQHWWEFRLLLLRWHLGRCIRGGATTIATPTTKHTEKVITASRGRRWCRCATTTATITTTTKDICQKIYRVSSRVRRGSATRGSAISIHHIGEVEQVGAIRSRSFGFGFGLGALSRCLVFIRRRGRIIAIVIVIIRTVRTVFRFDVGNNAPLGHFLVSGHWHLSQPRRVYFAGNHLGELAGSSLQFNVHACVVCLQ